MEKITSQEMRNKMKAYRESDAYPGWNALQEQSGIHNILLIAGIRVAGNSKDGYKLVIGGFGGRKGTSIHLDNLNEIHDEDIKSEFSPHIYDGMKTACENYGKYISLSIFQDYYSIYVFDS